MIEGEDDDVELEPPSWIDLTDTDEPVRELAREPAREPVHQPVGTGWPAGNGRQHGGGP